jgi:acyl-CoA thioesterase I
MPLGTSSTAGVGSPATAGYRGPLEDMLTRDGIAFDMVGSQHQGPPWLRDRDHEGHSGWVLPQMQPLVAGWVRAARPDVILLHVGTNDLVRGSTAAQDADRLAALLDAIHTVSDAYVIVAGVWAPLPRLAGPKAEFARLSAQLVARLRAAGRAITYVDTARLLGPGDMADGLHADASGYVKIAAMWEGALRARQAGGLVP